MPPRTSKEGSGSYVAVGDISHGHEGTSHHIAAGETLDPALFDEEQIAALLGAGAIRPA